jgi:deoxyribodipyrimidine photo-lyase
MKACRERADTIRPPFKTPDIKHIFTAPESETLESLNLLPSQGWDKAFYNAWSPGEQGADQSLKDFLDNSLDRYAEGRDYPAQSEEAVSRLSPHLHFGEISPFQIWQAVHDYKKADYEPDGRTYTNEILWREFAYHLLYNLPDLPDQPMNKKFSDFEWVKSDEYLTAWQQGQTGYPIVDAGMRQLWQIGWMHNRVRMIAGSFLVKDLQIDWRYGAEWFWDTLVDADLANNSMGWQWVAGCGPDAAPFFRIFNPVTQSRKFDPDGAYIRQYIPELANMPDKYIHAPWTAPENIRKACDYPPPVVDHAQMRKLALEKYKAIK